MAFLTNDIIIVMLWILHYDYVILFRPLNFILSPAFKPSTSCQEHWHSPEEESHFLLVQEVVRVARSLRAQCGMTKERPDSE